MADGWYHVTARGNERRAIFRDDRDRTRFVELLGELTERFGVRVHAYVLMDNHYHLLVSTPQGNLSAAMQWLGVSYSVWFNRRHGRAGHLFQGRFKAVVLEGGAAAMRNETGGVGEGAGRLGLRDSVGSGEAIWGAAEQGQGTGWGCEMGGG